MPSYIIYRTKEDSKRLNFRELCIKVLSETNVPMSADEIWEYSTQKGYDKMVNSVGLTPNATIYSLLLREVRSDNSIFKRVSTSPYKYVLSSSNHIYNNTANNDRKNIISASPFRNFNPHDLNTVPAEPGIYVIYCSNGVITYIGESNNVKNRINTHKDKFWFKEPLAHSGLFVKVDDTVMRRHIEDILLNVVRKNTLINKNM